MRRDEVALLAGISSQYYTKLERGNAAGVSDSIIDGIARALQLDEAERTHLVDLIRAAGDYPRTAPDGPAGSTGYGAARPGLHDRRRPHSCSTRASTS